MKRVILCNNRIVSLQVSDLQYRLPLREEEVVDAPKGVGLGWYKIGEDWIPPERQRNLQ